MAVTTNPGDSGNGVCYWLFYDDAHDQWSGLDGPGTDEITIQNATALYIQLNRAGYGGGCDGYLSGLSIKAILPSTA